MGKLYSDSEGRPCLPPPLPLDRISQHGNILMYSANKSSCLCQPPSESKKVKQFFYNGPICSYDYQLRGLDLKGSLRFK